MVGRRPVERPSRRGLQSPRLLSTGPTRVIPSSPATAVRRRVRTGDRDHDRPSPQDADDLHSGEPVTHTVDEREELRRRALTAFLDERVREGYRIETRTDTHAII